MTAALVALSVVVALLALLVAGLLRSHAEILQRLHELGAGLEGGPEDRAPTAGHPLALPAVDQSLPHPRTDPGDDSPRRLATDISGANLAGDPMVVRVVGVAQDTVLMFLSSDCASCDAFWEALHTPGRITLPPGTRLVVITRSVAHESPAALERLASHETVLIMSERAWGDYDVQGSPYIVHVDGASGRIRGEGTGRDWAQVGRLLAQASGDMAYVGHTSTKRRKASGDAARERRIDSELLKAGILPGDASLYPGGRADA